MTALIATAAFAQSSVTLSGIVDAGYQSNDYKGKRVSGISHNGSATSTIQLSGTEDLGQGLKASFKLNSDFNPTSNQANAGYGGVASTTTTNSVAGSSGSWLNGEMRLGLSGGFGAVDFGVINNLAMTAGGIGNPFGTAIGSGFRALYNTDVIGILGTSGTAGSVVRFDHTLRYTSPSFSGLTALVSHVSKNDKASSGNFSTTFGNYDRPGVLEVGLRYSAGPLNAMFSQQKQKGQDLNSTNADVLVNSTLNTLGANYNFGSMTAFGLYQTSKARTATETTLDSSYYALGARYTMGAIGLMAQFGSLKNDLTTSGDKRSRLLGLGADYNVSKRTALYVRHESLRDKNDYVDNPSNLRDPLPVETTRNRTAVGVRHTF